MSGTLRRRLRHARRFGGYGALVVLILAAAVVGVANQLLPLVERNPDRVAAWLSERIGQPVAFDSASGVWTRRGPRFRLQNLRIGAGDRVLDVGQAELLVAVYSGLLPGAPLTELKVRDLSLSLEQSADGRWRLAGLPGQGNGGDPLETLEALGELQVERARLTVVSPLVREAWTLPRVDLRLRVGGRQLRAGVRAWAVAGGAPITAVADLSRGDWSGTLWAGGEGLALGDWSPLLARAGVVVAGRGDIDLWARLQAQRIEDVRTRAAFAPVALSARQPWLEDGDAAASPATAFQRVDVLARWQADVNGWQLHAPELHFHEPGLAEPRSFDGLWLAGGRRMALQAPAMDLAPAAALAKLSDRVPPALRRWLHAAAPGGDLRDVNVQSDADGQWRGAARLDGVAWRPDARSPGVSGLSGALAFDQDGGVLRLVQAPLRLDWPLGLREPLEFRLDGTLGAWRDGDGWRLGSSGLVLAGPDYGATLRGELGFQGDGSRPWLDLAVDVADTSFEAAKRFWILHKMPESTVEWLDRGLVEGRVEQGRLVMAGDLDDWPFAEGRGRFEAQARVVDARVRFNPDWPDAEALALALSFDGPGMAFEGTGAILGSEVQRVSGRIADFKSARLELQAESRTDGAALQALMLASPLAEAHGETLRSAEVSGPADVLLRLDLPLGKTPGERRVEGDLRLSGARLADPRWGVVLEQVTGRTRFDRGGFTSEGLDVRFEGQPAVFDLAVGTHVPTPGLAVWSRLAGRFRPEHLLHRHEALAWLQPWLVGSSAWTVRVEVPADATPVPADPGRGRARLFLDTDLVGTGVALPAPLAKPAGEAMALHVESSLPVAGGDVQVRYGDILQVQGRMDAESRLRGVLAFGAGEPASPPAEGLLARGRVDRLDVAGWLGFTSATAAQGEGGGATAVLRDLDLSVARLDLFGGEFPATRVQMRRLPDQVQLELSGPSVQGGVRIPLGNATPAAALVGRFERLHWPQAPEDADAPDAARTPAAGRAAVASPANAARALPAATAGATAPAPATPAVAAAPAEKPPGGGQDPAALPPLDFTAADLRLGDLALGEASLQARPVPGGLAVERFQARGGTLVLDARGEWLGDAAASRSRFDILYRAESLGDLLTAQGLAGVIKGGETEGRLSGSWPGSPAAFRLADFEGKLSVQVGEGQLLEVEPGGSGRVLGLISLAEIPRRLSLDFRDFFEKGFGFNTIAGQFEFAGGMARTDDLQINGPAAEISVRGTTNLRAQTYDQRIEVLPKAGGVLPAIGAIAGGPVGAAVGAVAQAVLQKPLKQAARTVYHVTGPWRDPDVVVVEKGPADGPSSRPGSPAPEADDADPAPAAPEAGVAGNARGDDADPGTLP